MQKVDPMKLFSTKQYSIDLYVSVLKLPSPLLRKLTSQG